MELQKKTLRLISECSKMQSQISSHEREIERLGRDILEKLKQIDGWDVMIQHCRPHYEEFPKEFFGWCVMEYTSDSISFVKDYSNGDEYTVLEIDLNKSLESQVAEAKKRKFDEEEAERKEIEEKERAELERLKNKYK